MTTPTIYRSDDSSAPTISGTAGSLKAALKAILVDGYGSKSAAGWSEAYTGTNKSAFRQGGTDYYLRLDDSAAQMGRVVGYRTMSDVDTGTEPFPTAAQFSGGLYIRKSTTANSTARPWVCLASAKTFYLFILSSSASFAAYADTDGDVQMGFGKFRSVTASDANDGFLTASTDTSTSATGASTARQCVSSYNVATTNYLLGSYDQTTGAIQAFKKGCGAYLQNTYSGDSLTVRFPEHNRGSLVISRVGFMQTGTSVYRGYLPGLRGCAQPFHTAAFQQSRMSTLRGYGSASAASLFSVNVGTSQIFFDLTEDWD